MQFFSKICNFSQKICIGICLKFSYTYKKNAIKKTSSLNKRRAPQIMRSPQKFQDVHFQKLIMYL